MPSLAYEKRPPGLPMRPPREQPLRRHALPAELLPSLFQLRRMLVYLWLKDGSGFWFFIEGMQGTRLWGHAWQGQSWRRRSLSMGALRCYY